MATFTTRPVIRGTYGVIAAGQRGYFSSSDTNCAKAGNTVITIIAGPLNYVGVNPKVTCTTPQPTR